MIDKEAPESITKIIDKNKKLIIHNYKDKKDQILVSKKLVDGFDHIVQEHATDSKSARNLLKHVVKKSLKLSESDVVVCNNGQCFIKLFDPKKKKDSSQERRFDGIDEKDLKSFYDTFCIEDERRKTISGVAKNFVATLKKDKVTNEAYETNVFKDIQSMIRKDLTKKFDKNEKFFHGFSGYFFRIHFEEVFGCVASIILQEIAKNNSYFVNFIKYYGVDFAFKDGVKYEIPAIRTKEGAIWNTPSILSIIKKYFQSQEYKKAVTSDIESLKKETAQMHKKIESSGRNYENDSAVIEYNKAKKKLDKKMADLKKKEAVIAQNTKLYDVLRSSFVKALIAKRKVVSNSME